MATRTHCPWCLDPDAQEWDDAMCELHMAEYEGESVESAARRDREQYAEWADTL